MHMYFKSFGDDVERARRKPYRNVRPGDWQAICENFMTPTFQNRSAINKANKAKNLTNHRDGSKPFVTLRYEMRNMETEDEPYMVTFYHRTHCREDGTWVTQHCQGLYDKMIHEVNQQENSDGVSNSSTQLTRNEIYFQIVGSTLSYVRGLGHGEMSTVLYGEVVKTLLMLGVVLMKQIEGLMRQHKGLKRQIKGLRQHNSDWGIKSTCPK
ncbi:uncharacterized protein LOC132306382 [Cornus florida]|uniref:uncharacterized protein LOC132306382 n=1 Tax=Cornus florida TaxID=4283 RepID=UPI0028A177C6|nr:uncharacterized protein LOC132306382 [Cornus florida]XP_059659744.1 uncharacterized protein LOC132306382 [Cornus florida]XP_059659745.1 uncharacterized protein LOC132306382 [Cornus florida]XP_059659746.1 uncharacterized protein LOC132306382 [Cornus florida]XP_059659747.1 uncharacterized protein LOC132306382 [Cornus florida]